MQNIPKDDKKFISSTNEWMLIFKDEYAEMLHKHNFSMSSELYRKWKNTQIDDSWKDIVIPSEYDYAYPFQKETLRFLKHHNFNALLALDCGLGKTMVSLIGLDWLEKFPVLVIAPVSVKMGWLDEYKKFINKGDKVKIIKSSKDLVNYHDEYDIIVSAYGVYPRNWIETEVETEIVESPSDSLKEFKKNRFAMLIIDEAHKLGGEESKTAKAVAYLADDVEHLLSLSGTPFLNSPKEIYNVLHMHRPDLFKNRFSFNNRYCLGTEYYNGKKTKNGKKKKVQSFNGASNTAELHDILVNNIMIRFLKKDVLKDLPEEVRQVISIDFKNRKEYDKIYDDYENYIRKLKGDFDKNIAFKRTNDLRQEIYQQKKDGCFEFIDDLLEKVDKVVLFAHHKKVVSDVMERYGKAIVKIDGSCSTEERDKAKKAFMNDPSVKIIIGNMKSMGEGVNGLQEVCSTMCFLEFPWHPGMLRQAIDRLVRIGQLGSVLVYFLVGLDSIDEDFFRIIDRKQEMFDKIIEGIDVDEAEYALSTLTTLVNRIKRRAERRKRDA